WLNSKFLPSCSPGCPCMTSLLANELLHLPDEPAGVDPPSGSTATSGGTTQRTGDPSTSGWGPDSATHRTGTTCTSKISSTPERSMKVATVWPLRRSMTPNPAHQLV